MAQAVSRRSLTTETRFTSGSVDVGLVVDKVALGQVIPRVLRFFLVSIIPRTPYASDTFSDTPTIPQKYSETSKKLHT
jgi:hypothetical protein